MSASDRRYVIGLDEAGYGPNLGPLVVGASVWSVPAELLTADLPKALSTVLTDTPAKHDERLHVADSKQVYQSHTGIANLERSVLSFVGLTEPAQPASFYETVRQLHGRLPATFNKQPWYGETDLTLPIDSDAEQINSSRRLLSQALSQNEIRLETLAIDVVCPERFNAGLRRLGNKSTLLSETTFQLLERIWPQTTAAVEVLADKHGGRNRYQEFLLAHLPTHFFVTEYESRELSRYRCGNISISLGTKSERHFPVAVAAMTAKYIRETSMMLFNRYWQQHKADFKPTKGYPQDAKRFRADIAELLTDTPELIDRLWREK